MPNVATTPLSSRARDICCRLSMVLVMSLALDPAWANDATADLPAVDTALIIAVDVSDSVNETRYQLQMEGIARALEDRSVATTITSGPNGAIAVALVEWADRADVTIDWQIVRNAADALRVAALVRALKPQRGEYTCLTRMMQSVGSVILDGIPARPERTVLDISGDGIDNCTEPSASDEIRDDLIARGVTINGLPIIVEGENEIVGSGAYRAPGYGLRELPRGPDTATTTLDAWFHAHIIGGPGAFILPANGYEDFGRAFRQKFVTEISANAHVRLEPAQPPPTDRLTDRESAAPHKR